MAKGTDRKRVASRRAAERQARHAAQVRRRKIVTASVWAVIFVGAGVAVIATGALRAKPRVFASTSPGPKVTDCAGASPDTPRSPGPYKSVPPGEIDTNSIFVATIKTYCGNIAFKIDPQLAPDAASAFIYLAQQGYYTGLRFDHLTADAAIADTGGNPGFHMRAKGPAPSARADLAMAIDAHGEAASSFFIGAGKAALPRGVRIGTLLQGDKGEVLDRLLKQSSLTGLYILQIEIQEFSR